jgi:two-component system, NtrC family, sensor kinase
MDDRIDYTIPTWDRTDSVSRTLVRLIAQSTNDGIWDWNLETDEVYYSPRWLELVGYLPNELPGNIDTFRRLVHPDDRENAARTISEYVAGTLPEYRNELRLQHKNGSWRWIFTRGIAHRDATGRAIRLVGAHTDITERVHAAEGLESTVAERTKDLQAARDRAIQDVVERRKIEEALRENRQLLESVLENSAAAIYAKRRTGEYTYINREWEAVSGLSRDEVLGRTDFDLFPNEIAKQFQSNDLATMAARTLTEFEERVGASWGEQIFLSKGCRSRRATAKWMGYAAYRQILLNVGGLKWPCERQKQRQRMRPRRSPSSSRI